MYVQVVIGSATYHGSKALIYATEKLLAVGTIVTVNLRGRPVTGMVAGQVQKPGFAVKPIAGIPTLPSLPDHIIPLLNWMCGYYASPLGAVAQLFLPKKIPQRFAAPPRPHTPLPLLHLPPLTKDQAKALQAITGPGMHLLHGETGSGKTRVYIELAYQTLQTGKSAMIITPEIGLTSQLARDFRAAFGDRIVVFHSQLTNTARQKAWLSILTSSQPLIVIGPRSVLFTPLKDPGLIILDEAHETAYKQDQAPYYHAARVASSLATITQATIVLGTATPLVTDYFLAEQKNKPIIRMQQTARSSSAPKLQVVDLRDRTLFTAKSSFLSVPLLAEIHAALRRGDQVLLFLNRRGTARVVFCRSCGWQAVCPHCDLPLIYHGDHHSMRCHTCRYTANIPGACPSCGNAEIVFKSIGTKAVAEEVARIFPEATLRRFDTDNKKAERIEQHFEDIRDGSIDIIVGTQTLAKGLDLPKLGLVGVIIADTSLYFPDFSATERTYQLLSQVIGRVGRGHRTSAHVIVQTYAPNSSLLQAVLNKDWERFYSQELAERKAFLFPPFCYLLKLTCRRATQTSSQQAAERLAAVLPTIAQGIVVEGPTPAFHEKIAGKYQWQIIVKAKDRSKLLYIITQLPSGWLYDIDPMNLL